MVLLLIMYLLLEEFYFLHFINGSYLVGLITNWNGFHSFRWMLNIILIDSQLNTGTVVIIYVKWLLFWCVHEVAKIAVLKFDRAEGPSWVCKLAFPDHSVGILLRIILVGCLYYFSNSRFWSQIIYDNLTLDLVLRFLQGAPPYYILHEFPQDDEMLTIFQKTRYLVFLVINRLATYSESEVSKIISEKWNLRTSDTVLLRADSEGNKYIFWVEQNSFNLTSDNPALEKVVPRVEVLLFTREKLCHWNRWISGTCSKRSLGVPVP